MPGFNTVSASSLPKSYVTHAPPSAGNGFDNVGVGNGAIPLTSAARMNGRDGGLHAGQSPHSHGMAAGFPLRQSASLESLAAPSDFGQIHDPSGLAGSFGTGGGDGGDGLHRADYLNQIERTHPLDPGRQSPRYQGQHGQDIARELSSLIHQWDQRAGAIDGLRTPQGATPPDELFSRTQIDESSMSREHCARTVLAGLGVKPVVVETLLRRHARSEGCTAILDACRLLTMPELVADPKAHVKLQKQLKCYLDAARGEYSGVYRPFGHHSSKEIKKLTDGVEKTVAAIGYSVVKDRLLADLAPALVHALERKNPGMSSEALRGQLPELINAQAFSALTHRMNNANASGLLQDAALLPQFVETAQEPKPPPAVKAADPVNDFVKHLVSVLGAIKPPTIHIENNARQTVNQDGWNFQGNKDPRAETAVEVMPLPIEKLLEVDDAEEQALDEGIDMTEVDSETDEIQIDEEEEAEVQDEEVEPQPGNPPRNQRSSGMGRFGAPVHPLHVDLMSDLRQHGGLGSLRKTAADGFGGLPELIQRDQPVITEEEDDEWGAPRLPHADAAGKSDGRTSYQRLATPIPMGMHAHELSGRTRE